MDIVSPDKRSAMMAKIKGKDTTPEMIVRRGLHARGFRFRLHDRTLPGRPDLVFPKYKAVIFVHGCFWHGHEGCKDFRLPKTRTEFWREKIEGNRARDEAAINSLQTEGWRRGVVWECALRRSRVGSRELALDSIHDWLKCGTPFAVWQS
jgi:DNA mismatch endonuclease, patch repair protein